MLSIVVFLIVPAQSHKEDLLGVLDYTDSKKNLGFLPPLRPKLLSKSGTGHSFQYVDEYTQPRSLGYDYHLGQTFCGGRHKLTHPVCSGQDNLSSGTAFESINLLLASLHHCLFPPPFSKSLMILATV